jgi:oxygen-independent coproporphyrinogen-3 oxidase
MAGLYIHIPYCKKLCNYCDFYHVISPGDHSDFIKALVEEADQRKDYIENNSVSTIYIGGGTPSVLSLEEIDLILGNIIKKFSIENDTEITIELNPDDIDYGYAKGLKNAGINRISIGIQSWRDEDLKMLNRRHTSEQTEKALANIFKAGFINVSADLIYGIPGMNVGEWEMNLTKTLNSDITHISAYHLTVEPGTLFGKMKEKGEFHEISEEESTNQYNSLIRKTETAGFIQYEISNFAKKGFFSKHNSNYWKQVTYIGLGPSAHSFNGYSRQWNLSDIGKYITQVSKGEIYFEREELDSKTRFNEYIMTGLRTMWGINLDYIERTFEKEGYDYIINMSGKFIDYGLMKQENGFLVLTNQGKMISDNIISELMMPQDR